MILEVTVALVVATVIGMAFEPARWVGVMSLMLLLLMYPWACLAISIAGAAFYFIRFSKRRSYDAISKRSDDYD